MIDDTRSLAARLLAASPLAMSIAEALAQTQDRRRKLLATPATPEPDFTKPEPVPASIVDAPEQFGRDFWRKRKPPGLDDEPPKPKPKKPKGRRPLGDLDRRHDRFRVVPGGKDGDNHK